MPLLGSVDLEFLVLNPGGTFDERTIADSGLTQLGTGRVLDQLASLLDRDLIERINGGFRVSAKARSYLWDSAIPLWGRVLRLVEICPLPVGEIVRYLDEERDAVRHTLEELRKGGLAVMYPVNRDGKPARVYEATEDGRRLLSRPGKFDDSVPPVPAADLLSEIIRDVVSLDADQSKKDALVSRLEALRGSL